MSRNGVCRTTRCRGAALLKPPHLRFAAIWTLRAVLHRRAAVRRAVPELEIDTANLCDTSPAIHSVSVAAPRNFSTYVNLYRIHSGRRQCRDSSSCSESGPPDLDMVIVLETKSGVVRHS